MVYVDDIVITEISDLKSHLQKFRSKTRGHYDIF